MISQDLGYISYIIRVINLYYNDLAIILNLGNNYFISYNFIIINYSQEVGIVDRFINWDLIPCQGINYYLHYFIHNYKGEVLIIVVVNNYFKDLDFIIITFITK